ncbi:hypothetical protein J6590_102296, partial [Homalodisca vitripennis]
MAFISCHCARRIRIFQKVNGTDSSGSSVPFTPAPELNRAETNRVEAFINNGLQLQANQLLLIIVLPEMFSSHSNLVAMTEIVFVPTVWRKYPPGVYTSVGLCLRVEITL